MCTVTGCELPLSRQARTLVCPARHAYDCARSGYVNLLQPQDRKSPRAGDSPDAVAARARLYESGVGTGLIDALVERVAAGRMGPDAVVADLGCGSGELLTALAQAGVTRSIGIDLSSAAVARAAKRAPALTWVVANADRRIPLLDGSVARLLSVHARRHPAECARVLAPDGWLLVAVPAPDDLIELRTHVLGPVEGRSRIDAVLGEHADRFALRAQFTVRVRHRLERPALLDLLAGTYRGARSSAAAAVATLSILDVTLASDVAVFSVRPGAATAAPAPRQSKGVTPQAGNEHVP
jgi:23S rRNA (guanine745-N1)-methyltransferase